MACNDETLARIREELYTPVIGDILDTMGLFHQFLSPSLHPVRPEMKVAGFAMPVLMMDVYGHQEVPFGKLTQALDSLEQNEVYVAGGAMHRSANWGEILTVTAKERGAAGAVVDGFHRDTPQILREGFPVFSCGAYAQDSGPRMSVVDYRVSIEIGDVLIRPGDLIVGDEDGVVVVPHECTDEVIRLSLEKARTEKVMIKAIQDGMSVTDAFEKYGVL